VKFKLPKSKFILLITFGVLIFFSVILLIFRDSLNNVFSNIEKDVIESSYEYSLKSDGDTLTLSCLIGYKENELWCYSIEDNQFSRLDFLEEHIDLNSQDEGLKVLELDKNSLSDYDVEKDRILNEWYQEINNKESELFFKDFEENTHVDLYNLSQWRIVESKVEGVSKSDIATELLSYTNNEKYQITTPVRFSILLDLFDRGSEEFESVYDYISIPSNIIESTNNDSEWDFSDLEANRGRLSYYAVGLSVIDMDNPGNSKLKSIYSNYEELMKENNEDITREELIFLGTYLPLGLSSYSDVIYNNFVDGNMEDYIYFLDNYRDDRTNYLIKLNLLYDEYKDI
jgi:hypothetical protein